ncbi:MAG TPA: MATE family efflux transporter [Dehalococcoidales bacterium]|nr:MATE family efflux transporter [Dehalococcoidales bacterium]
MRANILETEKIGALLFKLAVPVFLGMFVVTTYNVVNTVFIGHYVGPLGIAGLSIVFPFQMLSMGIGQVTGMGGASLISRLIGAHNTAKAEKTLGNAISFNLVITLVITIAGLANPEYWLKLAGASDTILPYARDYMTIIFIGLVANTFAMSFNGLLISEGNTRLPMIAQIMGAGINIVLDAIFIIWFGWGVKGAALGTVIAQFTTSAIFFAYYLKGNGLLKIRLANLVPDLRILKEILAIGVSALAATLASSVTAVLVMRLLAQHGGDLAISTFGIINRIMMFSIMPGIVIGQALQPIIGFNYGAKRYDRLLKGLKIAIIASTSVSLISFLVLYFLPEPFVRIFTTDPDLVERCIYAIRRAFFFMYLMGFLMIGSTLFQALGKAGKAFIASMARTALFFIPTLLIMANYLQLEGVWLTFPLVDFMTFCLILGLFIPQVRELRRKQASILKENQSGSTRDIK